MFAPILERTPRESGGTTAPAPALQALELRESPCATTGYAAYGVWSSLGVETINAPDPERAHRNIR